MLNSVTLMGRFVRDPDLRKTGNGVSVASYTLAVDRDYQPGGEKQTDFINVVSWKQGAEFVCKNFSKGDQICVKGRIQTRSYEDKNGDKRTAVEVVADNVYFCGVKKDASRPQLVEIDDSDGEIPF